MAVSGLDHVNIDTDDLDATVSFYEEVLGLEARVKPSGKPGVWLYAADHAVIHVNMVDQVADGAPANLNHVAFLATDLDATVTALSACGVDYEPVSRPDLGATLVNFFDPNGIPIELVVAFDS